MAISRIRAVWTGFVGAPGVSTFYSLQPETDVPLIHGFFQGLATLLPVVVAVTVEGSGDVLDETTGDLTGSWSTDQPTGVQGEVGGPYAAPAGAVVNWLTTAVLDGSRLRGKTYLVPIAGVMYESDGSLATGALDQIRGAAASLAADNSLVIWHRPRAARAADGSRPAVTARAGGYADITSSVVRDSIAILTSRRD